MRTDHPPVITSLGSDRNYGLVPATTGLTAAASDPDGDRIAGYEWSDAGDGSVSAFTLFPYHTITWTQAGTFHPAVRAVDGYGARSAWVPITLSFGDEPLQLSATPDAASATFGALDGYTVTIANPNDVPVIIGTLRVHTPQRFRYVHGSTTGLVGFDPYSRPRGLTWPLDWYRAQITLPAHGSGQFHFQVNVATSGAHAYDLQSIIAWDQFTGFPRRNFRGRETIIGEARSVARIQLHQP
jgi:hypothetical protein